ncbi:hypothetical protein CEXT_476711 [Caerostris extrusa]|uniref:Uncharacterized protein n=1 Tax=Caerostris extrusa TaxID=172846 RepID=A0AAV4VIM2_CAEEX|nr:hypothetical protein CEXT_476711 [Caerostris extrusa]
MSSMVSARVQPTQCGLQFPRWPEQGTGRFALPFLHPLLSCNIHLTPHKYRCKTVVLVLSLQNGSSKRPQLTLIVSLVVRIQSSGIHAGFVRTS